MHHIGITVADLSRALRFYTEGVGCEFRAEQTSAARYLEMTGYPGVEIEAAFVQPPASSVRIELQVYHGVSASPARAPGTAPVGSSHICLLVDDVDEVLINAERAGGARVTDPVDITSGMNEGGRAVYLRDPDGYTIELFQPPARE